MASKLTYFDFAESDYQSLVKTYGFGVTGNLICSNVQKTCERYLKHLLDTYAPNTPEHTMHSHSLKSLKKEIKHQLPDFSCNWSEILKADGFYFTATYPGDDAFFAEEEETKECMEALEYTRNVVLSYIKQREGKSQGSLQKEENNLLEDDEVKSAIISFDDYDALE